MANINLSQNSYVDYVGSMFLRALNVQNASFTPKIVKVGDEDVILIHVSGVQTSSGVKVNFDLWPRNHATEEDIKKFPKTITDVEFRIGYWPAVDENGEQTLREGTPKWTAVYSGDKVITLSGEKREFGE